MNTPATCPQPIDDGRLWSFLRTVMAQGVDIAVDAERLGWDYEARSARLDAAAAQRSDQLVAMLGVQPSRRPSWVEIVVLVNEYAGHVADAAQHQAASREDIAKTAALATLGKLRALLGYGGR